MALRFIYIVIFFIFCNSRILQANTVCHFSDPNYKYDFNLDEAWDTIPRLYVKNSVPYIPQGIAIYPKDQRNYFESIYAIIGFINTRYSLCQYKFSQIVEDICENYKQINHIEIDKELCLKLVDIDSVKSDSCNHVCVKVDINTDSATIQCIQDFIFTKYGFIIINCFNVGETSQSLEIFLNQIRRNIHVHPNYQYCEPKNENPFSFSTILISLGIGLAVYVLLFTIDKKTKCKK